MEKKSLEIVRSDLVYSKAALDEYALLHMYEFFGWRELAGNLHCCQLTCTTDTISGLFVLFPVVVFEECLTSCHTLSAYFLSKLYMQISEHSPKGFCLLRCMGPILH